LMKTLHRVIFFFVVGLYSCDSHPDKIAGSPGASDTGAKTNTEQTFETPLLKTVKDQQDYICSHNISQTYWYARPLGSREDTFAMDEIQDFDRQGRLVHSFKVNGPNSDTFWRKTFLYNINGVLERISMKLENGQTNDEIFTYTRDGHLLNSFLMANYSLAVDTSWFKYSKDTIYKFAMDGGQTRPYPDIEILNSKGLIEKSIDHLPAGSSGIDEIRQKTYTDTCPIPKGEVIFGTTSRERIYKLRYY
jgi:hypothetical protein